MSVKSTSWQRIFPIFFTLLFVLLLLLSFWEVGPKILSNLGKLIDTITASPNLASWIENVEKNYQFFVFLFSMIVISMGLTRWLGKRLWYQEQISRRKELKLPVASLLSSDTSSFSYSSLFQGGLLGLAIVSWYFLFVFAYPGADGDVLQTLPLAMFFPIVTLAISSIQLFLGNILSRRYFGTLINSPVLIMSSIFLIGLIVISFLIESVFLREEKVALPVQIIITVIVCLCYSYVHGVNEGLKAADPESTYPLVSIEVMQGTCFDEAWLYERTDSDYRIVTKSGSNHIIPASNVKQIRGL
jgi:hypothetical protein